MGLGLKMTVKGMDRGWNALRKTAKALKAAGSHVRVGVMGDADKDPRPGEISNAELALIHEFGAPSAGIPERSFVRSSFEKNRPKYLEMLRRTVGKVYDHKISVKQGLGLLGMAMAADMKRGITSGTGIPPPNTPEVFRRKLAKGAGAEPPRTLVDSGRLLNSITWDVVIKGSAESGGTLSDAIEKFAGGE
jgi:hypothetical protein